MQNASDLKTQLQAIHRKSYPAYKSLKGSYQFRDFILHIDHVQGDPFASPSHIRIRLSHKTAGFPATYYKDTLTRVTLADYLTRQFETQILIRHQRLLHHTRLVDRLAHDCFLSFGSHSGSGLMQI